MATPEGKTGPKQAGVLPIRPAQTQGPADSSRSARSKAAAQDGIKAKVRRLPPGLTEHEFLTVLGDSWKPGNGKVGWFSYHCGHTPKSASKDSTPAFAFLQVKEEDLEALDQAVQNATWEDAKGTFNSPSLVGPPYVERSIYKKMPLAKPKKDPKEGTIDQDEDYKAFLASLAEDPTMKPDETAADAEDPTKAEADAKITIAPLAQFIKENREKKANKAKEAAAARSSKHSRQESQGAKGKGSSTAPDDSRKKSKEKVTEKPKETVRILKKQAATEAAAEAAKAVAKDIKAGSSSSDAASSRRAGIQGIANILKRDLGLSNGSAARKARQEVAKQEAAKKGDADPKAKESKGKDSGSKTAATAEPAQATDRPPTPTAPKAQAEKSRPGRSRRGKESKSADSKTGGPAEAPAAAPKAPVILQKKKEDSAGASAAKESPNTAKPGSKQGSSSAAPIPPTGPKAAAAKGSQSGGSQKKGGNPAPAAASTRAFLKHANPSQGVTEALLKEAMQAFGSISFVEIDRRKGFAYVDFSDHAGLAKAMAASPVPVAQATVQVLERKDQGSKKAASTPTNQAQSGAVNSSSNTVAAAAAAGPANPPTAPLSNADKSGSGTAGEQQQPKRSRRRGRGRGGNGGGGGGGGGGGNNEGKTETVAGSSAPVAADAGGPGAG